MYLVYYWDSYSGPMLSRVTRESVVEDGGGNPTFAELIDEDIQTKGFYDDSSSDHDPTVLYLPIVGIPSEE